MMPIDEAARFEMVSDTMERICALLPRCEHFIWSDGAEILCETEQTAETIADLLDAMYGEQTVNTGYYDPAEDERNNEVDFRTGFYYVTVN